jgi:hypothetical protein
MEDLLTSNTFGLMTYLEPDELLLPFIGKACSPLLRTYLPAQFFSDVIKVERWRFWPTLSYPSCKLCEPDVEFVLLHRDGTQTGVLIEAKYRSGKSSFASEKDERPNDQLAREYDNLRCLAEAEGLVRFALIYLTADWVCPQEEVQESADEYCQKCGSSTVPMIYWLSWRTLASILERKGKDRGAKMEDLHTLLLKLELTTFCRLRDTGLALEGWRFSSEVDWDWSLPNLDWSFAVSP